MMKATMLSTSGNKMNMKNKHFKYLIYIKQHNNISYNKRIKKTNINKNILIFNIIIHKIIIILNNI